MVASGFGAVFGASCHIVTILVSITPLSIVIIDCKTYCIATLLEQSSTVDNHTHRTSV